MKLFKGQDNSGTDTAQDYRVSPSSSVATKTVVHVPAAATKATVNVAATPGVRHVCAGISASIATAGTAQTPLTITLYDGDVATGVVKWAGKVAAPANSSAWWELPGLAIEGTVGKQMTLEFSGAGVAASEEAI